jgi:hypothetical protein
MPETRGREIHEIVQALASKNRFNEEKKKLEEKIEEGKKIDIGMVEIDLNEHERKMSEKK